MTSNEQCLLNIGKELDNDFWKKFSKKIHYAYIVVKKAYDRCFFSER